MVFNKTALVASIDMALEVKQKASVCWFNVDFGLNLSRFIEQLCPKKRKNSVTLDLHSELDGRMAIVKSHEKIIR